MSVTRLGRLAFRAGLGGTCAVVLAFLVVPILIIVVTSFTSSRFLEFPPSAYSLRWYHDLAADPRWLAGAGRSFGVGIATMAVAGVLGTMVSLVLNAGAVRGEGLLRAFVLAPLVVPKIITAVAMYFVYAPLGLVGTEIGLVSGHVILAIPFVVLIMSATLKGYDRSLTWAALGLGATPLQAFARVMAPILLPGIVSAALFAFLASFDDVIIALFLSGVTAETLPKQMYDSVQEEVTPALAAVSTILALVTVVLWGLTAFLLGPRGERKEHAGTVAGGQA